MTRLTRNLCTTGLVIGGTLALTGCEPPDPADILDPPDVTVARVDLNPTTGEDARGMVTFTSLGDTAVQVTARVTGLTPGAHGFHIHELGDCTSPEATSAEGHFAPRGNPHGGPDEAQRHVGDLGNLVADANGVAIYDRIDREIELGQPYSIVGRSVVVHNGADDLDSQPAGEAGDHVACGVIGIAGIDRTLDADEVPVRYPNM